jgi:hypothetical protein
MKIKSRTRLDFRLYLPPGLEDAVSDLIGQVPGMVETISLKCALAAGFLGGSGRWSILCKSTVINLKDGKNRLKGPHTATELVVD